VNRGGIYAMRVHRGSQRSGTGMIAAEKVDLAH
jgi:hypothetical protein